MNNALGDFLCPPGYAGPRGLRALAREGSVVAEALRGHTRLRAERRERSTRPYVSRRPVASHPVVLIPGFLAGDWSLVRLAAFLRAQDYRTYRSHILVNVGCTREAADRLERRIEAIATRRDSKVSIVGHSLGGMLARGLAARRPDLIDGIVTMGSPVLAPAAVHEVLEWNASLLTRLSEAGIGTTMSVDCVAGPCARESWAETAAPLHPDLGFTAIYSQRDGIVDWRSCLDPQAQKHIEVRTSHVGMAVDPIVYDHVHDALQEHRLSAATRQAGRSESEGLLRVASR